MRFKFLLLLTLVLGLSACASKMVPPPNSADFYFKEGEQLFEKEQYDEAIASWEKVRDSYYSPELNVLAELKIAEAYFLSEKYIEAATAYEDFLKQHPEHDRTPLVLYQLGMSYYNQILTADRDQTATKNAKVTLETLLKRHPSFPKNPEVRDYVKHCDDLLAENELVVGRFYVKTGKAKAAIARLAGILKNHPKFTHRDEVYFELGSAYLLAGQKKEAAEAFNSLYKEFPSSHHIGEAQKLLEKSF